MSVVSFASLIPFSFLVYFCCALTQNNTHFICSDGQVIDLKKRCDGRVDCVDGMDETIQLCFNILCPFNQFRCHYGACIPANLKCDGKHDCADESDESQCLNSTNCKVDEFQCTNGDCIPIKKLCDSHYDCKDSSDEGKTCKKIPACPKSMHRCNIGACIYRNQRCDGRKDCIDGSDESRTLCESLKCKRGDCASKNSCPAITSPRIRVRCKIPSGPHKGYVPCNTPLPPGSIARYKCKPYYIPANPFHKHNKEMSCQPDGTWSRDVLQCIPDCGVVENSVTPLIVKGWETKKGKYPWHAVLYTLEDGNWTFSCGATLITERVVLTAAHCTWEFSKDMLRVGLGKYYTDFYKYEDSAQILNISEIIRQPAYQDVLGNFGSDIAILLLDGFVELSPFIKPACIDWNLDDFTEHLSHNALGLIVGMGRTETDTQSKALKGVYLPVVNNDECLKYQKRDFKKYVTYTSFCAGWRNGSGVCNGDSGGGLVFLSNEQKYTLQGIVSVSPRKEGTFLCDPYFYTIFTKVGMYVEWIYDRLKEIHEFVRYEENAFF